MNDPERDVMTSVPLETAALDGAIAVRTFHHGVAEGVGEMSRVLSPRRQFVVDWSGNATGFFDYDSDPRESYDPRRPSRCC